MIIYRSFYEAIKEIPAINQAEVWDAIFSYGMDFREVELTGLSKTIFTLIKPQLEANIAKYKNGIKPKNKQNISKQEAKHKQIVSKAEGNVNDNVNDNEKDVVSFENLIEEFSKEKPMRRPILVRASKDYSLNEKEALDLFKSWCLRNEGKKMSINHAENSFNLFLKANKKDKDELNDPNLPSVKYGLSPFKNNDF